MENKWLTAFLKKHNVHHYVTQKATKVNYSERVIRTIKGQMYRYFTHKRTYHYLNVLQDIVRNYNERPHRSLDGKSPSYVKRKPVKLFKFKKGDFRISSNRHTFQRDYQQKWTEEIFTIYARYLRQRIPVYKLVDYDREAIDGTFYQSELQRVSKRDVFKVDKILKRHKRRGISEVLMSWLSYPKIFNSWIKETDLQNL